MKIFIWERVGNMSDNWHSEGGVVIVAKNLQEARRIYSSEEYTEEELTEEGIDNIFVSKPNRVYELKNKEFSEIFTFPVECGVHKGHAGYSGKDGRPTMPLVRV